MKNILLFILMFSSLFLCSCRKNNDLEESSNQDALSLKVSIRHMQSSEIISRIITNNNWYGQDDRRIAVSLDGEVREYNIDDEGYVTSVSPFYWKDNTKFTLSLWYPYNDGVRNENVVVRSDQSDNNNFISSDCLEALNVTVSRDSNNVELTHRTAKVVFKFTLNENAYISKIVYDKLVGVENDLKEVICNPSNEVLLAPQTLMAGQARLRVIMNGGWADLGNISPDADVELKPGMSHIFEVKEDEFGGVTITFQGTMSWNYKEESINGISPEVDNDIDTDDWDGDKNNVTGSSPEVDDDIDTDDWDGNKNNVTGSSPEVDTDGEVNEWESGNESVTVGIPEVGNDGEVNEWNFTEDKNVNVTVGNNSASTGATTENTNKED